MYGFTASNKQRYACLKCKKTFIWKNQHTKINNEQHWFYLWVKEGYAIRQLAHISGHSEFKLKGIKNYWLAHPPESIYSGKLSKSKHIVFDGTYFHKDGCLAVIIDAVTRKLLAYWYIDREHYISVMPMFKKLQGKGLIPVSATMDGHPQIIKAMQEVWPEVKIQRCLYHIKHQGTMWLRLYPKTGAGKSLKKLIGTLTIIFTSKDRDYFVDSYSKWLVGNQGYIKNLPKDSVANKDLKRAMSLIRNALPNMFHYIEDRNIPSTTNMLEGLFSHIKHHCMRHRGLSLENRESYLLWFCYFWSQNSNTK